MGKLQELKKHMKRVMPFVQIMKEKMQLLGLSALNLTLEFDEFKVLQDNKKYLENTLDVSIIFFLILCIIEIRFNNLLFTFS